MKALVLGRGLMGKPIAHGLRKLGYVVKTIDQKNGPEDYCGYLHSGEDWWLWDNLCGDVKGSYNFPEFLNWWNPDVVISALPYFLNENVAKTCIKLGIPYCDLGGHIGTSKAINRLAKQKSSCVMTDLGLAPGLVNIMALDVFSLQIGKAEKIEMYCGGLPSRTFINDLYKYKVTWSEEGLINEYKDDCEILRNGNKMIVPGMSGLCPVKYGNLFELEAFHTSGAASHSLEFFKNRGVKNCWYKTLRYPGHHQAVKPLVDALSPDGFKKVIQNVSEKYKDVDDVVYSMVRVHRKIRDIDICAEKRLTILGQSNFTAMQIATAYPCVAIADQIAKEDFIRYSPMSYEDVDLSKFVSVLKKLGVDYDG